MVIVDATQWFLSDGTASGTLITERLASAAADASEWARADEGSAILELIPDADTVQVGLSRETSETSGPTDTAAGGALRSGYSRPPAAQRLLPPAAELLWMREGLGPSHRMRHACACVWRQNRFRCLRCGQIRSRLTFVSKQRSSGTGPRLSPTADALSLVLRHGFLRLPKLDAARFVPRVFHPSSGMNGIPKQDFTAPLGARVLRHIVPRWRLGKPAERPTLRFHVDRSMPRAVQQAVIDRKRPCAPHACERDALARDAVACSHA
jgi:hypothetical protein